MGIYTKVADPAGAKWVEIGADESGEPGLPGLGGWATIREVTGVYKPHRYNDGPGGVGGTDWVAYEWTDDGSITVANDGLVDFLVVGSGSQGFNSAQPGSGSMANDGIMQLKTTTNIRIGVDGPTPESWLGSIAARNLNAVNAGAAGLASPEGYTSSMTGVPIEYGQGGSRSALTPGSGGYTAGWPKPGVVIVRVPKAYADGVAENFHGWESFALVTDGVVTEVTRVPDNEPHTLDAEWVLCSADVRVGWDFVGGVFSEPTATEMPAVPDDV